MVYFGMVKICGIFILVFLDLATPATIRRFFFFVFFFGFQIRIA